jgi:cytochrome c
VKGKFSIYGPLKPDSDIPQKETANMKRLLTALAISIVSVSGAAAQDVAAGATSFKKCGPCHDVGPTAKNKVGPLLNGLDGRKSGTVATYSYSDANKNSGITWNEESFLDYIKDPKAKIPNTKMTFAGIKNESEAKSLWAYLKQYDADGKTK